MAVGKNTKNAVVEMFERILIIFLLFLPGVASAKTKFEVFVSKHPFLFALSLLGFGGLVIAIVLIPHLLSQRFGKEAKEMKRRMIRESVPKGEIEAVDLPPAILYYLRRNPKGIERIKITPEEEFVIGSYSQTCNLVLDDPGVSSEHAKLRPEPEGYVIYDLGSETGTKVNGKKIIKKVLKTGDRIRIGKQTLIFEQLPGEDRRKHLRVRIPVKFMIYKKGMKELSGESRDISVGGLRFESSKPIPADSVLELKISLQGMDLNAMGVVRWVKPIDGKEEKYLVGVEFVDLPPQTREKLQKVILDYFEKDPFNSTSTP